jgi:hypothetical protein
VRDLQREAERYQAALDVRSARAALELQPLHPLIHPVELWELLVAMGGERTEEQLERLRAALRWDRMAHGFLLRLELSEGLQVGVMALLYGGGQIHLWGPTSEPNQSDEVFDYPDRRAAFAAAMEMAMLQTREPAGWYRMNGRRRGEVLRRP